MNFTLFFIYFAAEAAVDWIFDWGIAHHYFRQLGIRGKGVGDF